MTRRKNDEKTKGELTKTGEEKSVVVGTEQKFVTLDDYYMPQKVTAFCSRYKQMPQQTLQSEVFTEARLREFFKAYPIPMVGDPLTKYLDALSSAGLTMTVTLTGEPAIIVEETFNL